jgi:hypothetical protein
MTSFGRRMLNAMAALGRSMTGPIGDVIKLPGGVRAQLRSQFRLTQKAMVGLECLGQKGFYGGERVGLLRVFDRVSAREQGLAVKSYGDLDGHPELVRFLGKKFPDGALALFSVRPATALIPGGV